MSETKTEVIMRTCPKCNVEKELNTTFWSFISFNKNHVANYKKHCKACLHDEYRAKNPDRPDKRGPISYFTKHKEKIAEVKALLQVHRKITKVAILTGIPAHIIRVAIKNGEITFNNN